VRRFRRDGYHPVRIEDVAEDAAVSVGTVYNYYSTKGDLLMATVTLEVEEVLAAGEAILADPPAGAEAALRRLIWQYYDHSLEYLTKEMWRAAMAISIEAPHTPNGRRYAELDARLADQVARLVARLQARGEVRADLDPRPLGEILFHMLNALFVAFVRDDAMTIEALKAAADEGLCAMAALMTPAGG